MESVETVETENSALFAASAFEEARKARLALFSPPEEPRSPLSAPNVLSLSGYAAGVAWLAGGNPLWAVWSILADEFDGLSARNLGLSSQVGDRLDWSVDACMLALVGAKIGLGWISLPALLFAQVVLKERGVSPPFGSTRAALMAYALL